MSDEEICDALGWPRRAAEVLAADSQGLLPRIRAVVREAERREREACAKMCENKALEVSSGLHSQAMNDYFDGYYFARAIRARNNK